MNKDSNYARKHTWLARNGMWGFDVPLPKPWRARVGAAVQGNRPCRYAAEIREAIERIAKQQDEQARRRP